MFDWQMAEVLDNINIGFFSKDIISNQYFKLSEGCPKIYGYSFEDFYSNGNLWYDVILDEDRHIPEQQMNELKKGEKSVSEYRIHHYNGNTRWIKVKAMPVFNNQELIRVEGIVYDITESKNAELEIIKSKELSENIINCLPGIFYLLDEDGRYLNWNKNFEKVTGFSASQIAALNVSDFVYAEDLPEVQRAILRVFETGTAEVEARLICKDKSTCMYYFNGQKVVIDGKNCLVGMGIDISERKAAEEKLRKNEQMLAHIINSIPQSILWKDINGNFLGGNTVFASMTGLENVNSIVGKNDYDFSITAAEAEKFRADDMEVINSKQPKLHFIETFIQGNGQTKWLDTTKIPLKDINDEVYGILVVINDITEKKLKEDRQHKINEELIQKNIGLREFSYIVSHNLRAPISKILGLASLFEKNNPDIQFNKEIIEHISNEVFSLDNVVKDLNTILANQSAGGKLMEVVSLEALLFDSKQHFEDEIIQSGARIDYDFSHVKSIRTVKSYLSSIFNILISNAVKYRHPDRAPYLKIESVDIEDFICITFQDNGLGLDVDKYGHKIFGIYNNFHKGAAQGKGIGLKLAKTQIEALGGKIELISSLGTGSTFKVFLPHSLEINKSILRINP